MIIRKLELCSSDSGWFFIFHQRKDKIKARMRATASATPILIISSGPKQGTCFQGEFMLLAIALLAIVSVFLSILSFSLCSSLGMRTSFKPVCHVRLLQIIDYHYHTQSTLFFEYNLQKSNSQNPYATDVVETLQFKVSVARDESQNFWKKKVDILRHSLITKQYWNCTL